ncbi:uncharacterized protein LOC121726536 [Aricia agestis]|uniref:uncharacterized protein LOC121726536 n=1 Tax=Aricia agestis TaxID=91739 RepID=UPI001C2053CB|nr:uncharacterized protein LOC121726536 [Aricia agestis]
MLTNWLFLILCIPNVKPPRTCRINARTLGEPLPVIIRNGQLLEPTDKYGNVDMEEGEVLTLSCVNNHLLHPNANQNLVTANIRCMADTTFSNEQWLTSPSEFAYFRCNHHPDHSSLRTFRTCYAGHPVIEVGYKVDNIFYAQYESCFDERRMNPIYTKYTQKPYNANYQPGVSRLYFIDDGPYYGTIPVHSSSSLFSPWNQKSAVARRVGSVINQYIDRHNELSRGHLASKTDFVFAFGQRASFHYVNCAPQWKDFNGGNWNTLEVDLRNHIHNEDYETVIYTGTYGVTELANDAGVRVEIFLERYNNVDVIPIPQYFYKVVYEPSTGRGVAFVGLNNPHYSLREAERLEFCENVCENRRYRWLTWDPEDLHEGYSFCCTVPDFRNTVRHLPDFEVTGLFV